MLRVKNDVDHAQYVYSGRRVERMVDKKSGSYAVKFTYANGRVTGAALANKAGMKYTVRGGNRAVKP